jgi:DNA-binding transcriptional ArsR family regulator
MPIRRLQPCDRMKDLPPEALDQVASYFQALAEPSRLKILNLLREQEASVGDLAQRCGFSVANVSRHLALLSQRGLVARESRGNSVYYRIADPSIYDLCDLVCGNIARQFEKADAERAAFSQAVRR